MNPNRIHPSTVALVLSAQVLTAWSAHALTVRVTVENLAPASGTLLTPVWVGFHDGNFDIYDRDRPASDFPGLEALAEDGDTAPIGARFDSTGGGLSQGVLFGPSIPPLAPGESATRLFELNPALGIDQYFSYASMIIPSNDAFVANGNPLQHAVVNAAGEFLGADILVTGDRVLDAGTEVNDELPANTAFFGQAAPNTGVDEDGVVALHPGFMPAGAGGILDGAFLGFSFSNADFLAPDYRIARIRVTAVPDGGSTLPIALAGVVGMAWFGRMWRRG